MILVENISKESKGMFELHTWATECLVFPFDELKLESQVHLGFWRPAKGHPVGIHVGMGREKGEKHRNSSRSGGRYLGSLIKEDFQWGSTKILEPVPVTPHRYQRSGLSTHKC